MGGGKLNRIIYPHQVVGMYADGWPKDFMWCVVTEGNHEQRSIAKTMSYTHCKVKYKDVIKAMKTSPSRYRWRMKTAITCPWLRYEEIVDEQT